MKAEEGLRKIVIARRRESYTRFCDLPRAETFTNTYSQGRQGAKQSIFPGQKGGRGNQQERSWIFDEARFFERRQGLTRKDRPLTHRRTLQGNSKKKKMLCYRRQTQTGLSKKQGTLGEGKGRDFRRFSLIIKMPISRRERGGYKIGTFFPGVEDQIARKGKKNEKGRKGRGKKLGGTGLSRRTLAHREGHSPKGSKGGHRGSPPGNH